MSNLTTSIQLNKASKYKLNNGELIPVAGFGVFRLPRDETSDIVYAALDIGYRHFDSAVAYGNQAETAQGIQRYLKDHPNLKREDIWFTTKIPNTSYGYEETKATIAQIAADVKPYIDYVDLILIHDPFGSGEQRIQTWRALQEFVLDQTNPTLQIKSIGVSNFGVNHLEELFGWEGFRVKPVVNQLELHPWLPHFALRKYSLEKGILLEAYSPLTHGAKLNDPTLVALGKKFSLSPATILLRWSYLQGFIVLVKASTEARIKENLDVLPDDGKVELDAAILHSLDKLQEYLVWGTDATEYADNK